MSYLPRQKPRTSGPSATFPSHNIKALTHILLIGSLLLQVIAPAALYAHPLEDASWEDVEPITDNPSLDETPSDEDESLLRATSDEEETPVEENDPPNESEPIPGDPLHANLPDIEETFGVPAEVRLSASQAVLLKNQTVELIVEIWRTNEESVEGLPVTIQLPPALKLVGNDKVSEWNLPNLEIDETHTRTLTIKPASLNLVASTVEISISVGNGETGIVKKQIQIGVIPKLHRYLNKNKAEILQGPLGTVLDAKEGNLLLLVPKNTLPIGTRLTFEELAYLGKAANSALPIRVGAVQASAAGSSSETSTQSFVYLPLVSKPISSSSVNNQATVEGAAKTVDYHRTGPSAWDMLPRGEDEPIFHHWSFSAKQNGRLIKEFEAPLVLVYNADWLVELGVEPETLSFFSRETADDEWNRIPTAYLSNRKELVAGLSHFSEYKLGLDLNVKGDMLPSISSFSSDLFTGAATVSYPIEVPVGPGGMAPSLSLSYSSNSSNDFYDANRDSSSDWDTQASKIGIGWNLGGLGYIAMTDKHSQANLGDDTYNLVLNGSSAEIRHAELNASKPLLMVPEQFVKIQKSLHYKNNNASSIGRVNDTGTWAVTSQDGTKHTFGTTADPRASSLAGANLSLPQSMVVDFSQGRWQVNKWHLAESVDTSGNYITYKYKSEARLVRPQGGNNCSTTSFYNNAWYNTNTRPDKIQWGGNKNTGHGHTMQVIFGYSGRSDLRTDYGTSGAIASDKDWLYARCIQYTYSTQRLTSITVQVKLSNGSWKNIRQYTLGQSYTSTPTGAPSYVKHLRLDNVKHYGYNTSNSRTGSPLNTYAFSYYQWGHHAQVYLKSADNGWGGKSTYTYQNHNTTDYEISDNNVSNVTDTDTETYRRRIYQIKLDDGLGNYFYTRYGYGAAHQRTYRGGVDFLGHNYVWQATYAMNKSVSSANEVRYSQHWYHQLGSGGGANPDPRVGREFTMRLWQPKTTLGGSCGSRPVSGNRCRMQQIDTTWIALKTNGTSWSGTSDYHARARWIRKDKVITNVEGATNEQRIYYETSRQNHSQFGQVTKTEEWANGARQRIKYTQYYPNTSAHIVNKPTRMRTYAGDNATCLTETRNIYDSVSGRYYHTPSKGLVSKTETLLTGSCTSTGYINLYDSDWAIIHYGYDAYGNQTVKNQLGPNNSGSQNQTIKTTYDTTYHLFPVEVKNDRATQFKETAKYYGVNYSTGSAGGQWGATAEHCAVNEICTRLKYDSFGRPTYRWENVPITNTWGSDSSANVKYRYWMRNSTGGIQTNAITEWRSPRCYGNFVRRHYNGLGQLVHEQTPQQDWKVNTDGCNPGNNTAPEISVDYGYDSLGNQIYASPPRKTTTSWTSASRRIAYSNWSSTARTESQYDVLGRPLKVIAPNGERTDYAYWNRETKVVGKDAAGTASTAKMLNWTVTDALGYLSKVRTGKKSGSSWVVDAEVSLTHDAVGNLKTVINAQNKTASMSYNKVGQKLSMNDPDLGYWTYAYDRLGNLTRQYDERGKVTCLYYQDTTNRLVGKHFRSDTSCPSSVSLYDVHYTYDQSGRGPSKGMLTQILDQKLYNASTSNGHYKNIWYNDKGFVSREQVRIPGTTNKNTYYGYDSYNRPYYVQYPDNEKVYTYYNSMGLPSRLWSNTNGYLVDGDAASGQHSNTVGYNEDGLPVYVRLPKGSPDLWRTNYYYNWSGGNRRLYDIRTGTAKSTANRMRHELRYDFFGNVTRTRRNSTTWRYFCYDHQNRLTKAFGDNSSCSGADQSYTWHPSGRFNKFEGKTVTYGNANHIHAPTNVATIGSYSYDEIGNVISRPWDGGTQTLEWNHENRLWKVSGAGTTTSVYEYDDSGQRTKKSQGDKVTYYYNQYYELEVNGGVRGSSLDADPDNPLGTAYPDDAPLPEEEDPSVVEDAPNPADLVTFAETNPELEQVAYLPFVSTEGTEGTNSTQTVQGAAAEAPNATHVVKYYFFGGQRIAMSRNGSFRYLHSDHLGSTIAETNTAGVRTTLREYKAYGGYRDGDNQLETDRTFTDQQSDETGLMYYNARYYDPQIGHFVSPDTIVPDPTNLLDYNRYMYVRGRVLNMIDPSGHESSIPDLWPDSIPYPFDLPDGMSQDEFLEWVGENNIPTTWGIQAGGSFSLAPYVGYNASGEFNYMFNWLTGETTLAGTRTAGLYAGTPDVGFQAHGGLLLVAGAGRMDSVLGMSRFVALNGEVETLAEIGLSGSMSRGKVDESFGDVWATGEDIIDPTFRRTVDTLALNATMGIDAITFPNPVQQPDLPFDAGIAGGMSRVDEGFTFNLYAPFQSIWNWLSR